MNSDSEFWLVLVVAFLLVGVSLGVLAGTGKGKDLIKQEAVDVGAAYWQASPEGRVEFHWVILGVEDIKNE